MRRVVSFMALVTGISACGPSQPRRQEAPSTPPPAATSSAATEPLPMCENYDSGLVWCSRSRDGRAWLSYAIPETDSWAIGMQCDRGEGRVTIATFDPARKGDRLVLRAGGVTQTFPAEPFVDPVLEDGVQAIADVPVDASVLQTFRREGVLAVQEDPAELPARTEPERLAIETFFAFCEPEAQEHAEPG